MPDMATGPIPSAAQIVLASAATSATARPGRGVEPP
jgi:hypothetical protein